MTTYTIFSGTGDGVVSSINATYATARAGSGLTSGTGDPYLFIGQYNYGDYECDEGFISFDTSGVVGSVSSATLSLWPRLLLGPPSPDFTVNARRLDWGTLTTADWIAGASFSGQTLLATYTTVTGIYDAYAAMTSQAAFLTNINQSGTTGIILSSSRHEGNNSPSGMELLIVSSANESGTTQDPKLVVVAAALSTPVFMNHLRQQGMA